jgi:hypothetical protein
MRNESSTAAGDERPRTPLDTLRLDKTAFTVVGLKEADAIDRAYWKAQSPRARLQAVEFMRQVMYGYDPLSDRVARVFEVIRHPPR